MIKLDDEVITKVDVEDIPAGTFGTVSDIDEDGIWVDVYIPADDDLPYDTVLYSEVQLEVQ